LRFGDSPSCTSRISAIIDQLAAKRIVQLRSTMREVLWKENERKDAYHTAKEKERFQIMWANGMHGPEFVV
jgi:hypothetical protein